MASRRAQRRRGCIGKKAYTNLVHARNDAAAMGRRDRVPVDAYRCERCGFIHVGHRPHTAAPQPAAKGPPS